MVSWQDVIIVIILAYYWTAFDMFSVHKKQPPHIQPGYLRAPTGIRFFAGFSWPYTAYVNKEFAWFLTLFLSSSLTLGAGYILLGLLLNSISIKILVLAVLRWMPGISIIFAIPTAILSTALWLVIGAPFGSNPPYGVND